MNKKQTKDELTQKVGELTELLQRVQAEFENYRRRTEEERKESKELHKKILFEKLIPVIDMFEEALKHECVDKNYEIGMKMIYTGLTDMLENEGVTILNPKDEQFNPELHEALGIGKNPEKPDNTIIEVLKKGYFIGKKPIRRAKVIVNGGENGKDNRN